MKIDDIRAPAITRESLIAEFGGGSKGRLALARRIARIKPDAKLPKKGTKARARYENAKQQLRRAERRGQINPKTGRPYGSRPAAKERASIERIVKRERKRREPAEVARGEARGGQINGWAVVVISKHKSRRWFALFQVSADEWKRIVREERQGKQTTLEEVMLRSKGLDDLENKYTARMEEIDADFHAN